jgi:hypothetical protein
MEEGLGATCRGGTVKTALQTIHATQRIVHASYNERQRFSSSLQCMQVFIMDCTVAPYCPSSQEPGKQIDIGYGVPPHSRVSLWTDNPKAFQTCLNRHMMLPMCKEHASFHAFVPPRANYLVFFQNRMSSLSSLPS